MIKFDSKEIDCTGSMVEGMKEIEVTKGRSLVVRGPPKGDEVTSEDCHKQL